MKQYKSEIEKNYFTDDLVNFNRNLKDFIGAITRRYFRGFKQSSEAYQDLYTSIIGEIYGYLKGGHYEQTIRNVRLYRILEETNKWDQFGYLFNCYFLTIKDKKKFIKGHKFTDEALNDILKRLGISKHIKVKEIDFRSYLQTQIRGCLTMYFCYANKTRKNISFDLLRRSGYNDPDTDYMQIISEVIKRYNLKITIEEFLEFLNDTKKRDNKIYECKLISWCLLNNRREGI